MDDDSGPLDFSDDPADGYLEITRVDEAVVTDAGIRTTLTVRVQSNRLQAENWDSLAKLLAASTGGEITSADVDELHESAAEDLKEGYSKSLGPRVKAWLGDKAVQIAAGTIIGVNVDTLTHLVLRVLGF